MVMMTKIYAANVSKLWQILYQTNAPVVICFVINDRPAFEAPR